MAYLENETIRLRALEPEDLDVLYRWENDTNFWAYGNTLSPYSKYALREYIIESRRDIFQTRQLRLMITLKDGNKTVGMIDLYDFDPMNLRAGLGIFLEQDQRSLGLGTQALRLIEEYAFKFLSLRQLFAHIPQANIPSIKLFAKCNYKQTGILHAWVKLRDAFDDVLVVQLINQRLNS